MGSIVSQEWWNAMWDSQDLNYNPNHVDFKELFKKYAPFGGSAFEVGCYPGTYLLWLGKEMNMELNGIDMYPKVGKLINYFNSHGVRVGNIIEGDFLVWEPNGSYDLVFPLGFVEHFRNFDEVIIKHCRLVKPGGVLLISAPNLNALLYRILYWLLDRRFLDLHVREAMDLGRWSNILIQQGFNILFQGYYHTFKFFGCGTGKYLKKFCDVLRGLSLRINDIVYYPNRFTSPNIVVVARKCCSD